MSHNETHKNKNKNKNKQFLFLENFFHIKNIFKQNKQSIQKIKLGLIKAH